MHSDVIQRVEAHEQWLASNGEQGQQGDFTGEDLSGIDLRGKNLRQAVFERADLERADLEGASLAGAKFGGAILRLANLRDSNVKNTNFTEADLRDADLSEVRGLTAEQLMRAKLAGAKLPEPIRSFDGLAHVEATAGIARPLFLLNLILCIYAIAVITSTTDAALLTNAPSSVLPDINTPIPTKGFYYVVPAILFGVYIYFQAHIEQILQDIMRLPVVFPDGIPITRKIYPWIILRLLARNVVGKQKVLSGEVTNLRISVNLLLIALAWWLTPVTLVMIWLKFIPSHDWYGAIWMIALTVGSVSAGGFGIQSLGLGRSHPGFASADLHPWRMKLRRGNVVRYSVTASVGIAMLAITYGAYHGARASGAGAVDPKSWTPVLLKSIGLRAFADFSGVDVSRRAGVDGKGVVGAELAGRDLEFVNARNAYMENADLRATNLTGAILEGANLRSATLSYAILAEVDAKRANFAHANLRGALLNNANLSGANFDFATLSEARLSQANLKAASLRCTRAHLAVFDGADLRSVVAPKARFNQARFVEADLNGGSFTSANFESADLTGANLHRAIFDHARLIYAELSDATMTAASFRHADFTGANLFGVRFAKPTQPPSFYPDFSGADLEFSKGLTQDLLDRACGDDSTRLPDGLSIQSCLPRTPRDPEPSCATE